jgi:cellular nucleic acid-binding protein
MANIYILLLDEGKYYIGQTDNVARRYQEHITGIGSAWTKKYKPIRIEKTIQSTSIFDEDKITKEYMLKYGIENVRGGSFVQISLPEDRKKNLQQELWSAENRCFSCGEKDHFIKECPSREKEMCDKEECKKNSMCTRCGRDNHTADDCYAKTMADGSEIATQESGGIFNCIIRVFVELMREKVCEKVCKRCGRDSHTLHDCYAKTAIDGKIL